MKEPWQMTKEEYFEQQFKKLPKQAQADMREGKPTVVSMAKLREQTDANHKKNIGWALEDNEPVPAEVLKDYPDLVNKSETNQPWRMTRDEFVKSPEAEARFQKSMASNPNRESLMSYYQKRPEVKADAMKIIHERDVELAMKSGKPVPAEVLKDYPELLRAATAPAYQLTWDEYQKAQKAIGRPADHDQRIHKEYVRIALQSGRFVPAEVLKDYPDLARKETKPSVRFHLLPDNTLWVKELGGHERTLASWNPGNRPDSKTGKDEGGTYNPTTGERQTFDNIRDWENKVNQLYDVDTENYVAESWTSGGVIHKGQPIKLTKSQSQVVVVSKYKGDQLKAIHTYYDDMEDGHLDYKRPVSNRKPRITPRMPKLR